MNSDRPDPFHAAREALRRALEKAGSGAALAREIGVTRAAVCQWDRVPVERCAAVERATGIPRGELRPDVFGE
jgi:DNA-binding transcriptional regulator YdaS (Cro superfamily)